MSSSSRVGAAIAAGYFLGRFKKLRLALVVGSALANKNVRTSGLGLLQKGTEGLTSSPEAKKLTEQISSQLMQAGRAAAVTAAASRIDALSDRLNERSSELRDLASLPMGDEEQEEEYEGEEPEDEYEEEGEEEEPTDEYEEEEEEEEEPEEGEEEPEDEYEEEPEEEEGEPEDEYEEEEEEEAEPEDEEPEDEAEEYEGRRRGARGGSEASEEVVAAAPGSGSGREALTMAETQTKSALSGVVSQLPVGRLKDEAQGLGQALTQQGLSRASQGVESLTGRLNDFAEGKSTATKAAANVAQGDSPVKAGVKAAASKVKDTVKEKLGMGGGGGGQKLKVTNILESVDVPVSREVAYEQWTQFEDFPTFMKKVENVKQEEDEKLTWKAQIFWSHRSWDAEIVDQVPNERIVWKSDGEKGHVDGAITFHELGPELTRILMILEYHPKGLFEHTGNLWRAQGRRARLELKHFARHVSTRTILHQDELDGWKGEIHEGEVVEGKSESEEEESEEQSREEEESEEQSREEKPAARKRASKKSASAKKAPAKKTAPAKKAAAKKTAPAKKAAAKKTAPAKKSAPAKRTAAAKKSTPARTTATAKKSAPAKKTTAKKTAAKKSAPAKKTAAKKSSARKRPAKKAAAR